MQRLYKRRKIDKNGNISSNWSVLRENSAIDGYTPNTEDTNNNKPDTIPTLVIYDGGII